MNFEEFLRRVAPKFGANLAFDAARDARFAVLEKILIQNKITTQEEIERELGIHLAEVAENLSKMPTPPKQ